MDVNFWHKKWGEGDISFHQNEVNPLLLGHFGTLSLAKGSRIFLPLCGKTRDIAWLLEHGYSVAGAELSKIAVDQLFAELGVTPAISELGKLMHYRATNIDIFAGDIFHLSDDLLGLVDAIYDRAALVALPADMRIQYTTHLMQITANAPQLMICYEYDQSKLSGPPFSICQAEIHQHYSALYDLSCITSLNLPGGLKGKCAALENVWLLKSRKRHSR